MTTGIDAAEFTAVRQSHPLAGPLLAELAIECTTRYGTLVVAELEGIALQRGYRRVYRQTGWRQPEAVASCLAAGYTPLFDRSLPSEETGPHRFEKLLVVG